MPAVHKVKSRAKDFCTEAAKGRTRYANTICSWFVLLALSFPGFHLNIAASGISPGVVSCPDLSVSRESTASSKRKDTADRSVKVC
jgi:hypothetical protein